MIPITYQYGDATNPSITGKILIVHIVNDIGKWGAGFVLALSKRWPMTRDEYLKWYFGTTKNPSFKLGEVLFVQPDTDVVVANLIGQKGIRSKTNPIPIKYDAIAKGLDKIADFASVSNPTICMPRIGCGLAGGSWPVVQKLINDHLCSKDFNVIVYDFQP